MGLIAGEDTDWNIVATSWTVSAGRLADSVAVESPLSPIDDGSAGSAPKTPLLLRPPSPDRSPCEITISFAQRHEVRQVYVRSTARVYEIYYAPKQQTANEYLCTVRCSIVERDGVCDGDVPQAANLDSPGDSMDDLARGRSKSEINSNAGEDNWVEVKAPGTSFETNRDVSTSLKSSVKMVLIFLTKKKKNETQDLQQTRGVTTTLQTLTTHYHKALHS